MTQAPDAPQDRPFRVGIWMEYFPDWLVALGQDGISRLIGYVLGGFAGRDPADIEFVFWGPSFAQDKINALVDALDPDVRQLCRVARPSHLNPFADATTPEERVAAPRRPLSPNQDLDLHYVQEMVSNGALIYNRGTYEFNVRSDFILTAFEANAVGDIDVWYVPAPRFCHCSLLKAPVALAFPDYVYAEFPRIYHPDHNPQLTTERSAFETMAQTSIDASARVVTFSEHVKETHVTGAGGFDCPPEKIEVVRHGHVKLDTPAWRKIGDPTERARFCAGQVRDFLRDAQHGDTVNEERDLLLQYASQIPWEDTNFIFFPTALRPYKNIPNVVEAIRILKQERDYRCRLVTTANIPVDRPEGHEIAETILRHNLMFDVLSLPGVPDAALTALYSLATAAIAPSYFEGGFPFMVTEALSVDTPVIVGDIPVAREIFAERTAAFPFFDVHDPEAIADCIQTVCDQARADRAAVLAQQRELFAPVVERSWADAARDYEAVFRAAAQSRAETT